MSPAPELDALLAKYQADPRALVQILRELQMLRGWLPRAELGYLASQLGLGLAQVEGVASFYRFFHTQPVGSYRVLFSDSITDRMQGSQALLSDLCQRLRVPAGHVRSDGRVSITTTSCTGQCDQGPAALINHQRVVTELTTERIAQMAVLIEQAVPLAHWPASWSQVRDNIQHAGALLGAQPAPGVALAAAMARQPQGMLDEIKQANLRGCGGAGYATASKWQLCRDTPGQARYVVCNADEGEPGTFKDRVLLASFADTVFEGMSIAAWATGAQHGLLYLRGEYCFLLAPLQAVLQHRRQQGLLGKGILGQPGFDFDIQIHVGAGAYVCGEESALIESLQGRRGTPGIRPPYPAQRGYLGLPTVVNNVETLCAVGHIAWRGARWWTGMGTAQSSGSKIHSISGDCARPGLYEYAYGTSVQHMLLDCGAQCTQAVQIGGPSGVCVSASEFARSICFEDLASAGAFMVFDESRDMFEVARSFAQFFAHESCGFCTPCRVGSELVLRQLDKIQRGHGGNQDLAQLSQLGQIMQSSSHCGLGASAGGMLHNSISKFPLSYQRRLSRHFVPGFDLDAELSQARLAGARHVAATHLQTLP